MLLFSILQRNMKKGIMGSIKILTVFNIDYKKKCFLRTLLELFLKYHVTLKCHHRNKLHFKKY